MVYYYGMFYSLGTASIQPYGKKKLNVVIEKNNFCLDESLFFGICLSEKHRRVSQSEILGHDGGSLSAQCCALVRE